MKWLGFFLVFAFIYRVADAVVSSGALTNVMCSAFVPGNVSITLDVCNDDISGLDDNLLTVELVNCTNSNYIFDTIVYTLNVSGGSCVTQAFIGNVTTDNITESSCFFQLLNSGFAILDENNVTCSEISTTPAPTTTPGNTTTAPTSAPTTAPGNTTISPTPAPTAAPTAAPTPAPTTSDSEKKELVLIIVGVVLGSLAMLLAMILLIIYCYRGSPKKRPKYESITMDPESGNVTKRVVLNSEHTEPRFGRKK